MAKSPTIHKWRIVYTKGLPAATIGYVEAPDEQTAMERAIEKFNITPGLAEKLIAEKTKTQPQRKR
jgi:hypothetical protein